jgi:predicted dehydrogenase
MNSTNRRQFLRVASAAAAACAASPMLFAQNVPTGERITMAVIGTGSRGMQHGTGFAALPGVYVKYVCDVDDGHSLAAVKAVGAKAAANDNTPAPQAVRDLRKALEDKEVQAVSIATPDHWHAPAAILAAAAGKHVYVEKPCCHNPHEGEILVAARKKFDRVIQHGTQRRSWPKNIEAIGKVKAGEIGKVLFSRGWYANNRPPIGKGKAVAVPAKLDWTLWQGPAPETEYHDNYVPYNWHWFWKWGTGECGNNGIHALDLCRWGLGVDTPKKVTSSGGRYHYDDDWETPDTQFATFDFGDKVIQWEALSCNPRGVENASGFGAAFYGDKGTIIIDSGYTMYDLKNKQIAKEPDSAGDKVHFQNFIDAVRAGDQTKLNAPIEEGYKSTLLCHVANISQRVGRMVQVDPATGQIKDDAEAMKLWQREYRAGWEPKV